MLLTLFRGGADMAIDPKLLEEATKQVLKRAAEIDSLTLAMIKGHWAIDQAMDELLSKHGIDTDKSFSRKAKACEELDLQEGDQHWEILWAADSLRNELAHKRDPQKIGEKTAKLRSEYMKALSPQQVKGLDSVADDIVAHQACIAVAGFLYVLE